MQDPPGPRALSNMIGFIWSVLYLVCSNIFYFIGHFIISVLVEEVLVCADRSQSTILQGFYCWRGNSQCCNCNVWSWFLSSRFWFGKQRYCCNDNVSLTESVFNVNRHLIWMERLISVHAIMLQNIKLNGTMASRFTYVSKADFHFIFSFMQCYLTFF